MSRINDTSLASAIARFMESSHDLEAHISSIDVDDVLKARLDAFNDRLFLGAFERSQQRGLYLCDLQLSNSSCIPVVLAAVRSSVTLSLLPECTLLVDQHALIACPFH